MFGRKKKVTNLSKNDLEEVRARTALIQQHYLIAQALEMQKRIYISHCFKRLGLDETKRYEIDYKDGAITLVEEPKKKNESKGDKTDS